MKIKTPLITLFISILYALDVRAEGMEFVGYALQPDGPVFIPFLIHTHKNLATVPAHRTSNQAAKHQTPDFLTANER